MQSSDPRQEATVRATIERRITLKSQYVMDIPSPHILLYFEDTGTLDSLPFLLRIAGDDVWGPDLSLRSS